MPTNTDVISYQISKIDTTAPTQSRAAMNSEVVEQYASAMGDGAEFPPVVLFANDIEGTCFIGDGHHRVAGAIEAGLERIDAIVHVGTLDDAIDFACAANRTHGLYRSNADKRRAVSLMLERHANWSDRKIAEHCGVGHQLVGAVRGQLGESSSSADPQRVGKDGKARNAPTRAIGNSKVVGTKRQPSGGVTFDPSEWEGDIEPDSEPDNGLDAETNEALAEFRAIVKLLNEAHRRSKRLSERPRVGHHLATSVQSVLGDIRSAKSMLKMLYPAAPCECASGCDRCRQSGHLTDQQVQTLAQARR